MQLLCPHCLEVRELTEVVDPDRGRVLRCPNPACADFTVPLLYAEDYPTHPPTPLSIIGLSGHGKTVFIESLLQEIQQLGARWPESGFYFTWLDEVQMRKAYARLRGLRDGQLPKGTKTVFQQPQVIRLSNLPRIGGSQLVIFDTGGEAFLDTATLADAAKYVRNSPAVVWLLSLKKGDPYDTPDDVNQMMTVYLQTMARMGGNTRHQNLVLVLTKGDELLARPDLPEPARTALATADYSPAGTVWGTLEQASTDLEAWLRSEKCGYHNLVNLVRSRFRQVRYCVVSAQGAPADSDALRYGMMPRGVLAPLLWLWRLDRDPVWVEGTGGKEVFLSVADAIARADGGVVHLDERTYPVPAHLSIRQPVTIVGRGAGKTVLEVTAPGYGVGVATTGKVTFRGLTVRRAGSTPGDCVRLLSGELELADVTVAGGLSGELEGKPVKGQGLLVAKHSKLSAVKSEFRSSHGSGVLVIDQAHAKLDWCGFEGNGDAGFFARTAGQVTVTNSTARANQTGFWVEAAAAAAVEGNLAEGNGGCGVVLSGSVGAGVVVRGNRCVGNSRDGIQARGEAAPAVVGNACSQNKRNGLAFTDRSAGVARMNTSAGNGRNGVRVCDDATPRVEENTAEGNGECGVLFEDRGAGAAVGNVCQHNQGDGIRVEGEGTPELTGNSARDNQGYGIAVAAERSRLAVDPKANKLDGNRRGPVLDVRPRKAGGWWGR